MNIRKEDALDYHRSGKKGKIEVVPTKPVSTLRDLSLAYSPGVAFPCMEIAEDVNKVYEYTARGNIVAVITNGTAVLGLGNIGPEAAKPVMEGKAVLLKKMADIDGVDIELRAESVEEFVRVVKALEPSFGGINLEDIKAPECFEIESRLRAELKIPVMHDDQHGTAIISSAALLNALEITGKSISDIKMVVSGAGAAAISCVRLYCQLGLKKENLVMVDVHGVINTQRTDLDANRASFATTRTDITDLKSALVGADVFIGLSVGKIVTPEMIKAMNPNPIIFALANPIPEISYEEAIAARPDCIIATGRSDYPNQVNNVLGYPYVFRGALDVRATEINEAMKLSAVKAIAALAKEPVPEEICQIYGTRLSFGKDYLIPKPLDKRLITTVSTAVAIAAMESGVAQKTIKDIEKYKLELMTRMGFNKGLMHRVIQRAKNSLKTIVLPQSYHYKTLKAAQILTDEKIARPLLLGNRQRIEQLLKDYEIEITDLNVIDPETEHQMREMFAQEFFKKRQRKGRTLSESQQLMRSRNYFGVMMVHLGYADGLITGLTVSYNNAIRPILEVIDLEPGTDTAVGLYIMNTRRGVYLLADCTINKNPDEDRLVNIAKLTARAAHFFNIEPRIAFLSFSNFGSTRDAEAQKMANATAKFKKIMPEVVADGELQANIAMRPDLMEEFFPFSELAKTGANTFIFPNLAAANIAYKLLQELGELEPIGPILLGLNKPVHVLQMGASVREIVDLAAITAVDAQSENRFF
ncbi:MAG: NADP-dependent malic enzyme [Bacteroidia bacterium]|nr:NADP-dependent malic enzyme [Bacteroidia bacterium]